MRKSLGIFILLFAFIATSFGQIREEAKSMSNGKNNSFSISLPNSNKKDVEKTWTKFIKKYKGKTNKIKKTEEYLSDDAKIKSMSKNTVDVYSQVNQEGADTQITVWYDLGGIYLSSEEHPEKVAIAKSTLEAFVLQVAINAVEDNLKDEEKTLKKLNGDYKGLEKDKSNLLDDIVKFEKKIDNSRAEIIKNEIAQQAKLDEISAEENKLSDDKKPLKKLNSDYKGLTKDKSKLEKDIVKFEKKIEEARAEIVENETAKKAKLVEISNQEVVIGKVKTKLKEMN